MAAELTGIELTAIELAALELAAGPQSGLARPEGELAEGGRPAPGPSGEGGKGGVEVGLEMEELLKPHQFHGLHDPGVAHHQELNAGVLTLLGQLNEHAQAGGIDEINATEINHHGQGAGAALLTDKCQELLVGIGIQLAREAEQQATGLLLVAAPQGYGQSLQINDRSRPQMP